MLSLRKSVEVLDDRASSTVEQNEGVESTADEQASQPYIQRHPLVLAASAQAIDKVSSLVITDLCHKGIKLKGRDLPSPDQEVLITTGTFAVFANVCLSENGECELIFIPPLDHELLSQFEQEGKWATVMGIV